MHLVAMTNQEVVQPEAISGRGLPETEHLHLEKRSLAADEVVECLEDRQVEPLGVHLDEAKPRDQIGVSPGKEILHVPSFHSDLERTTVQPLAHAFVKPAVAVAFLAVLELIAPVRAHGGEVQRQDGGLRSVETRIPLQHRKHIGIGLKPEYEPGGADRQRDRECGIAGVRADVDRDVARAQEATELVHGRLYLQRRESVGAGMQPPRDLDPPLAREVDRLDHEPKGLRLRLEAE